jgi:magnesium transporter
MFAILDAVVDNYFNVIEVLSTKIEYLEDQLFEDRVEEAITHDIQNLKKEILRVRRAILPFREVIYSIEK